MRARFIHIDPSSFIHEIMSKAISFKRLIYQCKKVMTLSLACAACSESYPKLALNMSQRHRLTFSSRLEVSCAYMSHLRYMRQYFHDNERSCVQRHRISWKNSKRDNHDTISTAGICKVQPADALLKYSPIHNRNTTIRNMLVCGDGDLSFSADIAPTLDCLGIQLVATVLEDEEIHQQVYKFSTLNKYKIESFSGHEVLFGVDATNLSTIFNKTNGTISAPTSFDRIQFNFPHWRGKANNRYNRKLLSDFFQSAHSVLAPYGEIHVALCGGQGGCSATSLQEWKASWTASLCAAEHGLLLVNAFPFDLHYRLSSHRGVDRPFHLGKDPRIHVFIKPDGLRSANREVQLCCRHELQILIPSNDGNAVICSLDQILAGDAIEVIIQSTVPEGVRVEVPARKMLEYPETHGEGRICVFLIVYCSERFLVTRDAANQWRKKVEEEVAKIIPLRQSRAGRTVSHPFPYPALHREIKYHTSGQP